MRQRPQRRPRCASRESLGTNQTVPVLAVLREIDLFGDAKGCLVFLVQLTDGSLGTTFMVAQTEST